MELRKQKEIEFHNQREKARKTNQSAYRYLASNKKFYSITRASTNFSRNWLVAKCQNKTVLDYCCGTGEVSIFLAKNGADVIGIDISNESIKTCRQEVKKQGLEKNTQFLVMDAEKTNFLNNAFDIITCFGVLHHLDINKAYQELTRLLRLNGAIICGEALAHNPFIQFYRKKTPHLRTKWEIEHILRKKDIELAKRFFNKVELRFFHLTTLCAVPLRNTSFFNAALTFFEKIDSIILKLPIIKWLSWQVIIILSEPKR